MNRFGAGLLLIAAALFASTCGGGSSMASGPTGPASSGTMVVTVMGVNGAMSFSPDPLTVRVGQAVAWMNADHIVHQVVEDSSDASGGGGYGYGGGSGSSSGFATDQLAPGATSGGITFRATGIFSYHCAIHPSMTGNITVTH